MIIGRYLLEKKKRMSIFLYGRREQEKKGDQGIEGKQGRGGWAELGMGIEAMQAGKKKKKK
jgi:hypothetical protein